MGSLLLTARRYLLELRRRRVVRTLLGYIVVAWVLLQVGDVVFEPLGLDPLTGKRWLLGVAAAGLVPVAMLAWVFDISGRRVVRTETLPAAPASVDTAKGAYSPIAAVAILPFVDLSPGGDQGWFCDGLAAEIIDSLCCVRGLRVASRSAAFRFRGEGSDPREIGRQLGVDAVLEGTVRRSGDTLRVSAALVDTATGFNVWADAFERRMEDVFAVQSEIAAKVAGALRVNAGANALERSQRYAPRNLAAYEYYLRARQLVVQVTESGWRQAPRLYERAIELDPEYAQAHAGLADALVQMILWRYEAREPALTRASTAAARALDLAPELAEAHVAQGHIRSIAGDADGAQRSFERAIALNPELHEAYLHFARHLYAQGQFARSAELFEHAWRTRPDDATPLALAASALDAIGDHPAAEAMERRALAGLRRQAELEPENARVFYLAAGAHARIGEVQAGREAMEHALRMRPDDYGTLYNAACFYTLVHDHECALELLERAIQAGVGYPDWIEHDPDLAPLRELPKFRELLARLG
ncbi:MAG: TPR end-of-group domain-containing protein [Arenimonas sp.]